jgi:hypothetical protein
MARAGEAKTTARRNNPPTVMFYLGAAAALLGARSFERMEATMATKADFTPDEWKTLIESPLIAGFAISAADPSGLFGLLAEGLASAKALVEAKTNAGNALIEAVAGELMTPEGRDSARSSVKALAAGASPADLKTRALAELKKTAVALDAKAPADAHAFKTWLEHIAQLVAEASSEGGFLGFGGVKVSEAEKATLQEISSTLGA